MTLEDRTDSNDDDRMAYEQSGASGVSRDTARFELTAIVDVSFKIEHYLMADEVPAADDEEGTKALFDDLVERLAVLGVYGEDYVIRDVDFTPQEAIDERRTEREMIEEARQAGATILDI